MSCGAELVLFVELCCGTGAVTDALLALGHQVIGFDIQRHPMYRGELVIQDVRTVCGRPMRGRVAAIFASPPCTEFSQCWAFNKTRVPEPARGVELVEACLRVATEAEVPILLENVRGAQPFIGPARAHAGSFYFWGDVPAMWPIGPFYKGAWKNRHKRERVKHVRSPMLRARLPRELAQHIAGYLVNVTPPAGECRNIDFLTSKTPHS